MTVRRAALTILTLGATAATFAGCGDTLQVGAIPHNELEGLIGIPHPVYWLGGRFSGLQITEASGDVSGAYWIQYGDCLSGGQGQCTPPLRIVTTPDNSFLPGGQAPSHPLRVRGVSGIAAQQGRTIVLATGGVVVDVYAHTAALAAAAAQTMVPINEVAAPGSPLPPALPNTGFEDEPLPVQTPSPIAPLSPG